MYEFVDISEYQPTVNFRELKAGGIHAVMIRATYGAESIDRALASHVHGAVAAGLHIAFYHYAYPQLHHADVEAVHFCKVVSAYGGHVPIALDMEEGNEGLPQYALWSRTFNHVCHQRLGDWPYFYSNPYFIGGMKASQPIGKGLWLSEYPRGGESHGTPSPPHPWKTIAAWQYTPTGHTPGIPGNVDRDVAYRDIFGLKAQPRREQA